MDRRHALKSLMGMALCPLCAGPSLAAEGHSWTYQGATGPEHWGQVDDASKVCTIGSQQSPIDIGKTVKAALPPLKMSWSKTTDTIVNNGHTIQINLGPGSRLAVGADNCALLQFHFHRPSEHTIAGKNFPMEVHFVHRTGSGSLAVVGVLMTAGKPNPAFGKIVSTMPMHEGPAIKADPAINPNALLPKALAYYRYSGSLTTPPCSETVDWLLLRAPIEVAQSDIDRFATLYPMNARPVQKDFRRFVLSS